MILTHFKICNPNIWVIWTLTHHLCQLEVWYHMLQKVPLGCDPEGSASHTQICRRIVFLLFCGWYFCHNNNEVLYLVSHSSFLVCFFLFPIFWLPRLGRRVWTPSHHLSSWWSAGSFCLSAAQAETATTGLVHFLVKKTHSNMIHKTKKLNNLYKF